MLGETVEKYEIGDKIRGPPPFYTRNGHFHPTKPHPAASQKKVKIPQSL